LSVNQVAQFGGLTNGSLVVGTRDVNGRLTSWTKNGVAHTGVWTSNGDGTFTGVLSNSTGASATVVVTTANLLVSATFLP
jgi:hypothetical protein